MISHQVERIGIYHRRIGKFILWNGSMSPVEMFDGLPRAEAGPHGIPMKEIGNGRFGKQYEFQVPDPGIYVLCTEWSLITRNMNERKPTVRQGNPVLLLVEPAADYEQQVAKRKNDLPGLEIQTLLEEKFDNDSVFTGFVIPKFDELTPTE